MRPLPRPRFIGWVMVVIVFSAGFATGRHDDGARRVLRECQEYGAAYVNGALRECKKGSPL